MLAPELKAGKKCDCYWPLRKHIDAQFGGETAAQLDEALKALDALREDVRACTDRTPAQRARLYGYYRQLASLDDRLPLSEGGVRVDFAWAPAWSGGRAVKHYEGVFERAAILWNAGAVEATLGAAEDVAQAEGVKVARVCVVFSSARPR